MSCDTWSNEGHYSDWVGIEVPAGYYDREQVVWVAADSGPIIKILSVTDGHADLNLNGHGFADDPQALEIDDAELMVVHPNVMPRNSKRGGMNRRSMQMIGTKRS